jgi:hemerythrin-like metal-binding protein
VSGVEAIVNQYLVDFSVEITKHFVFEEQVLQQIGYPHLDAHKVLHQEGAEFLEALIKDTGSVAARTWRVLRFMNSWLIHHALIEDVKFKSYLEGAQTALHGADTGNRVSTLPNPLIAT